MFISILKFLKFLLTYFRLFYVGMTSEIIILIPLGRIEFNIFAVFLLSRNNAFFLILGACSDECGASVESFLFAFFGIIAVRRNLNANSIDADRYKMEAGTNDEKN